VSRQRGIGAGIGAYLLWGFLTLYWRALRGLDPVQLIGVRIIGSLLLLTVALSGRRQWAPLLSALRDRILLRNLVIAGVLLSLNWTTYVWAVGHEQVTQTALGYFIAPVFTVLIGIVRFHEQVSPLQRVSLGLAGVALVVLVIGYRAAPVVALVLATTWSTYGVFKRQVPLSPTQSLGGETIVLLVPAVAVLGLAAGRGTLFEGASTGQLLLLLFAGAVTAAPLLLFARAALSVPFTVLGPLNYLVPTINFLLGVVVFGEEFDAVRFVGFAFVWASLVLVAVDGVRATRPVPALSAS
jgi:chloramphenicol-sensitive protein RarD